MANRLGSINGVAMAYVMGLVNAGMALVVAFGARLSEAQHAGIVGFVNAALVLVAHVSHAQAKHTQVAPPAPPSDEPKRKG